MQEELAAVREQLSGLLAVVSRLQAAASGCGGGGESVVSHGASQVSRGAPTVSASAAPSCVPGAVDPPSPQVEGRVARSRRSRRRANVDAGRVASPVHPVSESVAGPSAGSEQAHGGRGLLVIGSSNVRRVMEPLRQIASRAGKKSNVHSVCLPGGLIRDVEEALPAAIERAGCSRLQVVAHVGTNDSCRLGSEDILRSYERLAELVKTAGLARGVQAELSICSIVPRVDRGPLVWSRVEGLNQRLRRLCDGHGCRFLDLRYLVGSCRDPLDRSGVHYTKEAATRVAEYLWNAHGGFLD